MGQAIFIFDLDMLILYIIRFTVTRGSAWCLKMYHDTTHSDASAKFLFNLPPTDLS